MYPDLYHPKVYDTSTLNETAAAINVTCSYQLVDTIEPDDTTGNKKQNETSYIDFDTGENATGFYLAIRDVTSCIFIHRVLVFYSVCPAGVHDLIIHDEFIAPRVNLDSPLSTHIAVTGTCVKIASPMFGVDEPMVNCLGGRAADHYGWV